MTFFLKNIRGEVHIGARHRQSGSTDIVQLRPLSHGGRIGVLGSTLKEMW